jgi:hypothetical protein
MSLLTELKRRNVIRMAGLYLVGAWLIAQASSSGFAQRPKQRGLAPRAPAGGAIRSALLTTARATP